MKKFFVAAICLAFLAIPGTAVAETKQEKALRAFEVGLPPEIVGEMGARSGRVAANRIDELLKEKGKSLPQKDRDEMIVRFSIGFVALFEETSFDMAQIYADELTERELDLMIEVYSNPEMTFLTTKLPILMERIMVDVQGPATSMAKRLVEDMRADGFLNILE